jgi:ParB family chromosome partitioning protein
MKRRDLVQSLLAAEPQTPEALPVTARSRVASGAVRAMGLELARLTDEARQAVSLREQVLSGASVVDLDPAFVEPSFMADRLARNSDADYRKLVDSIRTAGQQVPILVRPHPEKAARYQVAFGHRRRDAALELGVPVKAIVRPLSDQELVVAQGKENAERRNLSFIERALFAAALDQKGFSRATVNTALGVQTSEMTRLLSVAGSVPADIIQAIGPAPKAGRPRWMELAKLLDRDAAQSIARQALRQGSFQSLTSDRRFDALIEQLRADADGSEPIVFRNAKGVALVRAERFSRVLRLSVDERAAPKLGARLLALLPDLVRQTEAD